ncbi:MAG: FAD-binding oxidoreductase [Exilispira sp.]
MKKENFYPEWIEIEPPEDSFRAIFKWGAKNVFKHPNKRLYALMKKTFNLTDDYFLKPKSTGLEKFDIEIPVKLKDKDIEFFKNLVGEENIKLDTFTRTSVSYGKTMIDLFRLRNKIVENIPDIVVYPRNEDDIIKIVDYCCSNKLALYVYGGGSSVTRGMEATKGGITLDMRVHMNKVIKLNEINHTVTIQAGISGPQLENALNNAPELFNAKRRYTCGHFPQSFEYSVVGGWVVTRGAGQNSTYYGKIEDLVISQKYITPKGIIKTFELPAMATGPDIDQIMMGSEGTFGILTEVTLKIFHYQPENTRRFSYIFKFWDDALSATREIMQGQFGFPSVFRLSDPEETDVVMKLYGIEGSIFEKLLSLKGFKRGEQCLLLGTVDGDKDYTALVKRKIHSICKKYKAFYTTGFVTKAWEHGRFTDPYMREDLMDYGIVIDTLECGVNWETLPEVHKEVRKYCKSRPQTICMTHCSHFYPQGANLYFIFIGKMDMEEYKKYQKGILEAIYRSGASMSHHHGIGKMTAPWLEPSIGKENYNIFKVLKNHFDPDYIMNPGGTLGFDGLIDKREEN